MVPGEARVVCRWYPCGARAGDACPRRGGGTSVPHGAGGLRGSGRSGMGHPSIHRHHNTIVDPPSPPTSEGGRIGMRLYMLSSARSDERDGAAPRQHRAIWGAGGGSRGGLGSVEKLWYPTRRLRGPKPPPPPPAPWLVGVTGTRSARSGPNGSPERHRRSARARPERGPCGARAASQRRPAVPTLLRGGLQC